MLSTSTNEKTSFCVPNSVMHHIFETSRHDSKPLTSFEMVILLGLMALLDENHPERDVQTTVSELLAIIEVSKQIATTVDRTWHHESGSKKSKKYKSSRYSPTHLKKVHDAFLTLHGRTLWLHSRKSKRSPSRSRLIHILDSFGYVHHLEGKQVKDPHNLPRQYEAVNIGSSESQLIRIRRKATLSQKFERVSGVFYRLNSDLVRELRNENNTICFTRLSRKVFGLLRRFAASPTTGRLLLFIIRQRNETFCRNNLSEIMQDLGYDMSHPTRALDNLRKALSELVPEGIVSQFSIEPSVDRLTIEVNQKWYMDSTN